jgi:Holliday junction resolvasome RuvABC endonuclease subunit
MKVLGIHLAKGQLRYALLDGTKEAPLLVEKGRLLTTDPAKVPQLMAWYHSQFQDLLDRLAPDKISYRVALSPKKEQLFFSEFPFGILNLFASQRNLPIAPYTPQSFVASKLGLPKGTDLSIACDVAFGVHPPHWDIHQKHAVLVAWFEL